jgi:hypothetical protein
MSKKYFDRVTAPYLEHIVNCGEVDRETVRLALDMLAKEVERDVRHRAADIVNRAANDIHNMKNDEPT